MQHFIASITVSVTIFCYSAIFLKFSILQVFYSTFLVLISRVSFVYSFVCAAYWDSLGALAFKLYIIYINIQEMIVNYKKCYLVAFS